MVVDGMVSKGGWWGIGIMGILGSIGMMGVGIIGIIGSLGVVGGGHNRHIRLIRHGGGWA